MNPKNVASTTGWGVYCASSWTWCIGMFLPIILLDDYGWWGFIVFALPNVLGCAAFGYVMRSRERSEAFVSVHRRATAGFSVVTIAYHAFFAALIAHLMTDGTTLAIILAPALMLLVGMTMVLIPTCVWPILGSLVWLLSIAVGITIGPGDLLQLPMEGARNTGELIGLMPVLTFGFLLCPYLDLTFHRAVQASPSRHSFAIFGLTFLVMILLTCAYAAGFRQLIGGVLLAHIIGQGVFTVGAHCRELATQARPANSFWFGLTAVALLVAALPHFIEPAYPGDGVYLRFLVFYGLVFPVYVLLCGSVEKIGRATKGCVAVVGVLIALALPGYEIGFIERQTWLLLPPIVLILLVNFIMQRARRRAQE